MQTRTRKMLGHGAIITFIGLAAGFGLLVSLIGGLELLPGTIVDFDLPGDTRAWARAHAGGLMNGMLVLLFALIIHLAALPEKLSGQLYWMLIGTGYANTAFYWGGLLSPSRALTFGDNRLGESNIFGLLGFIPALVFAIVLMIAMVLLARWAFFTKQENLT